jgi:pimeloyl-ACP methyl ester carboxylesterase
VRRACILLAACALASLVLLRPERPAALPRHTCPAVLGAGWRCFRATAPLDHRGRVAGAVRLAVALWHRPGPPRPTVVAFAGGPGGAALPKARKYRALLGPLLAHRDLLVFDQRGTGVSGELSCPGVDARTEWDARSVADCARRLGPRRGFYASSDTADDTELIRRRLRIPRLLPVGFSYGTKTAADYARRYPRAVEALVLDSVVVADTDPLYRRSAVAAARILRRECAADRCAAGADPVADLERLVAHASGGVLSGDGIRITEGAVLHAIVAGGAKARAGLPRALAAAVAGDLRPLRRIVPPHVPDLRSEPWLRAAFSPTTYLATTCEDASFPWRRTAGRRARLVAARRLLAGQPDAGFAPFDHHVAAQYGIVGLCVDWPEAGARAALGPLPDVPALLLAGDEDALTPLEGAREVAAELPRGQVVDVPGAGHVLIGTPLAARALARFARRL